ncbi:2-oxo acid dehydrogenase subunit E2 [Streptomyces gardneri]|uniref:dihydrolipoamide acetyltransferase family protein n=1 Tax=Streptomyces gardneri TaxID=66892 RepID=UPI0006E173BE|nr:dihydrolipoamide acetyltransferase family protein [Streptomyces gardneri]QPK45204.1 2-oxo acid dehydrogenase subunit E2 [Streptomyces gardneri]WRK36521.1 dihydrolipoamide acetyltransferase family protein [Streptomyces venezuelae]
MAIREFRMPDVGEGLTEADILTWYVKPGDPVVDGQVVCEIETAKAAVELPVPFDGVVREIGFPEGATVDVGAVIISVDTADRAGPADRAVAAAPVVTASADTDTDASTDTSADEPARAERRPVLVGYGVVESSAKRRPRKTANGTAPGGRGPAAAPRPLAKPPVRKLAKDLGVDLTVVRPSGGGGTITRADVHAAAVVDIGTREIVERPTPAPTPAPAVSDARETRVPIKGVRKATAAAMVGSAFTAPHVTEFVTFDITRTMKLVEELKSDKDMAGLRVNPLLLIAKAVLVAVKRNPEINAAWDEAAQEIVLKHYVNLGIAAATPRGLIVPNIKDAHAQTLPELSKSLSELVATAREGKTTPAAMQGGTFTLTNIGVFGIDSGTPILNPGESAILAVGAIKLQPWVHKGKVKPRQVTTLALSFDHRLVDGELGSTFLADIAAVLEQPKRLITWA